MFSWPTFSAIEMSFLELLFHKRKDNLMKLEQIWTIIYQTWTWSFSQWFEGIEHIFFFNLDFVSNKVEHKLFANILDRFEFKFNESGSSSQIPLKLSRYVPNKYLVELKFEIFRLIFTSPTAFFSKRLINSTCITQFLEI